MHLAIIADTHMPRAARRLPDGCVRRLQRADLIIHAGDLIGVSMLEQLCALGELAAVHGNVDEPEVRRRLPARLELELGGARFGVVHDAGRREGRLERLRQAFPRADVVIFGHSHLPLHEIADDGFQIFNPGSPTERRRAPHPTMGIAEVAGGRVELELLLLE
ncbi:MAG TPA: metallophosphoesterase family protein [Solirubrobacteraceae bacterium]|nr:metallophosphoesterase family protein [Solirubrobacteraceae bacterium]